MTILKKSTKMAKWNVLKMLKKSQKLKKNFSFLTKLSATTIFLSTVATSAQASLTLIDSRMDLGANDSLDWSSLGFAPLTQFSTPISVTSVSGVEVTVDTAIFTASLEVFDVDGTLLDTFELNGTSSTIPDNSAIFLGVISDMDLIGSVRYVSDAEGAAGINQLSRVTVPEFSPIVILGLGLFLFGNAKKFIQKF